MTNITSYLKHKRKQGQVYLPEIITTAARSIKKALNHQSPWLSVMITAATIIAIGADMAKTTVISRKSV